MVDVLRHDKRYVTVRSEGVHIEGVAVSTSWIFEGFGGTYCDFGFANGIRVEGVPLEDVEDNSALAEPEAPEGVEVTADQLRDGDLVSVEYGTGDPAEFLLFEDGYGPLRSWQEEPAGRKFRLLEPAGEKVEDWSTLNEGDVVTVIQYFHSPPNGGTKVSRDATVQDAAEREVDFIGAPGEPGSTAVKSDGDEVYLVAKADTGPELGPDAPWILVEETRHSMWHDPFVAIWNHEAQGYMPIQEVWPLSSTLPPSEVFTWAELEEPAFILKGAA